MQELVLASTSPWRRKMLADAGINVSFEDPLVTEDVSEWSDPVDYVTILAVRKSRAVAARRPQAWVLGADQMAWDGREVMGKPPSPEVHLERLLAMRGRWHELVTGWALVGPAFEHVAHDVTRLRVRDDLSEDELRAYVATGEGSGCAGGYAIEGHGLFLFDAIEGDWLNILGLPLRDVIGVLRARGWRYG